MASTVSALLHDRKRGYLLALGELTGASMVSSTLIVGAVVAYSPSDTDIVCRGALVRDVVFFMITMVTVFLCFNDGTITSSEIQTLFGLYFFYVLVVLAADIYTRRLQQQQQQHDMNAKTSADDDSDAEHPPPDETTALNTAGKLFPDKQRALSIGFSRAQSFQDGKETSILATKTA